MQISTYLRRYKNEVRRFYRLNTPKKEIGCDGIFVIGTYKTGTTSMHHFFEKNGLRHMSINTEVKRRHSAGNLAYLDRIVKHYHSFDDSPWNKLDVIERYMKSSKDHRFILTTREPFDWFKSFSSHQVRNGYSKLLKADEESVIQHFLIDHNNTCRKLAKKYNKPLLEVNIATEKSIERKLLEFSGLKDRGVKFPHSNRSPGLTQKSNNRQQKALD